MTVRVRYRYCLVPVAFVVLAALVGCGGGGGGVTAVKTSPAAKTGTGTTASAAPSSAVTGPSVLIEAAIGAMLGKGSAHLDCTVYGSSDLNVSEDVGDISGRSVTTAQNGETATALLISGNAYLKAAKDFLLTDGFPQATAGKLAGQWVSVTQGFSFPGGGFYPYNVVVDGLTMGDQTQIVQVVGPFTRTVPRVVDGQKIIGISGVLARDPATDQGGTETVYLPATGPPLPQSISLHEPGLVQTCTYSQWGEPLHLAKPPHPVPLK